MIKLNMHEAKTHLSRYVELLARGEVIQLCKRNVPIAEIRGVPAERLEPRPVGLARGMVTILPGFDDPLPDAVLAAFGGHGE